MYDKVQWNSSCMYLSIISLVSVQKRVIYKSWHAILNIQGTQKHIQCISFLYRCECEKQKVGSGHKKG